MTGRTTLAVEAMLMHPRFPEFAEHIRAITPVGYADQADQAIGDALRMTAAVSGLVGAGPATATAADDLPGWLRLSVVDALARFVEGAATTCIHNPDPSRPQPVLAAAWSPGLVACFLCTQLFALPGGSVSDRTCDGCGHLCDTAAGEMVYPGMIQLGPLVFQYGTCAGCRMADVTPVASEKPLSGPESAEIGLPVPQTTPGTRVKPRGRRGRSRGRGRR